MGLPVLLIGKSGSGKSASLRNFQSEEVGIINVLNKPLPFKGKLKSYATDDYGAVMQLLGKSQVNTLVVDDAGYLLTNAFMRGHSLYGEGGVIFSFYNKLADDFWKLIEFVKGLPAEKIVYFMMHEDKNDFGDIKPKTMGKLLDEKVCIEGLFTIVLRAVKESKGHYFLTKSQGFDVSKTPIGLFDDEKIENDLKFVNEKIREYYDLRGGNANA